MQRPRMTEPRRGPKCGQPNDALPSENGVRVGLSFASAQTVNHYHYHAIRKNGLIGRKMRKLELSRLPWATINQFEKLQGKAEPAE